MTHNQFCTCSAGGFSFGIAIGDVQEIVRDQPLTPVPLAPRAVRGLMNLRGQIVAALDLRARLDLPLRDEAASEVCIVLRTADGLLGLLADEIGDVVELDPDAVEPVPDTLAARLRDVLAGAWLLPGRLLLRLDMSRLVQLDSLPDPAPR